MEWLESVDSIFPYAAHHRGLLLAAKDSQDIRSIAFFNAVYGPIAVRRLVAKLVATRFSFALLARTRIQRLASHQWHPTAFWLRCLRKAQSDVLHLRPDVKPIPVMMCPSVVFRKRAGISSSQRRQQILAEKQRLGAALSLHAQPLATINVLVLDDVLTSGGSLRQEWTDLQSTRQADLSVCLHALTLFRTPGVTKIPAKDVS